MIPFIDLQSQYQAYKEEIHKEMDDVLNSSGYILGPKVELLEKELASFTGTSYAITCSSGTDSLVLALMAMGIQAGDEVLVPAFTFFATAETVSFLGAKPVFVDILPDTYCMDPEKAEAAVTEKTKAIVSVSLFGQIGPMDAYSSIAKKYGIKLIEDGAQSFGAEQKGKKSLSFGDMGSCSFFPAKPLGAYGEGGAVFTNNEDLYRTIISLRNHGQSERYLHHRIGINGRLDALQAAVLLVKLRHFSEEMETRQKKAARYMDGLKGLENITLPIIAEGNTSCYAQFTLRVKGRNSFIDFLKKREIPTAIHYPLPLNEQPVYASLGVPNGSYPVSDEISNEVVSLPFSAFLTEKDQDMILASIRDWSKEN